MSNNRDPMAHMHPSGVSRGDEVEVPEGGLLAGKTLLPVNDRILVLRDVAADKIGSIVMAEKAKEVPDTGVIVALPQTLRPVDAAVKGWWPYKVGDQVMFGKFAGWDLEFDGKLHTLLRAEEIFGILVDKEGGEGQSTEASKSTPTGT